MDGEIQIPPPVSQVPKPNWQAAPIELTYGHRLLNEVDPERDTLLPEQQRRILAIDTEETLRRLLYQDLSSTLTPDILTTEKVFGALLSRELEVPQIIMSYRFYTLIQCMMTIDDGRKLVFDRSGRLCFP